MSILINQHLLLFLFNSFSFKTAFGLRNIFRNCKMTKFLFTIENVEDIRGDPQFFRRSHIISIREEEHPLNFFRCRRKKGGIRIEFSRRCSVLSTECNNIIHYLVFFFFLIVVIKFALQLFSIVYLRDDAGGRRGVCDSCLC